MLNEELKNLETKKNNSIIYIYVLKFEFGCEKTRPLIRTYHVSTFLLNGDTDGKI